MISRLIVQRRRRSRQPPAYRKIGLGCGMGFSISLAALVFGIIAGYIWVVEELPSLNSLAVSLEPGSVRNFQPTRLYDHTGQHVLLALENPAAAGRQYLTLDSSQSNYLPETLVNATLAAYDPDYWLHPGYTLAGLR